MRRILGLLMVSAALWLVPAPSAQAQIGFGFGYGYGAPVYGAYAPAYGLGYAPPVVPYAPGYGYAPGFAYRAPVVTTYYNSYYAAPAVGLGVGGFGYPAYGYAPRPYPYGVYNRGYVGGPFMGYPRYYRGRRGW